MFEIFKKINLFNFIEIFVIKRIAKKIIKAFPSLKDKGLEIIETHKEEILQKIQIVIFKYIEKYKNR